MTSYQKLKDKEKILNALLDNLYSDIKDLRETKTLEDLENKWNGYMPDKLEIIRDILQRLEMTYNRARDDLWLTEKRK